MKEIVFVTGNANKLREAQEILGVKLTRHELDLDELQEMDLAKIIEHKTKQAYAILGQPVMVEDAGLYVEAWQGFPGPFIKWVDKTMGNVVFAQSVPADNRRATWVVMYGFFDGTTYKTFEGRVDGELTTELRGESGWGFDPLFIPEGATQTYAEMGPAAKYNYSARERALKKLRDYLV